MMLKGEHLQVGYRNSKEDHVLLNDLNFSVEQGNVVALMGANGSGKSSLLKIISGIHSPLSGDVFINGKNTKQFNPADWSQQVSVVLTSVPEMGEMDVYGLISLGRFPYTGWRGKLAESDLLHIEKVLEETGLSQLAFRKVDQLSDGEKQRVMIARALAQDTPIVLLDEPTAFLDLSARRTVANLIKKSAKESGRLFIFSTHETELALQTADRFWIIGNEKNFYSCSGADDARHVLQREFA